MFNEQLTKTANQLVQNCKEGREIDGLDEVYDPACVSLEAAAMPGDPREFKGLEAIKKKHEQWGQMMDVHEVKIEGPFFHGEDKFGVIFDIDVTQRDSGQRMQMKEFGVYTVANGKIVREEFYNQPF